MKTRWNAVEGRLETKARGRAVLADPRLNRGTAFTVRSGGSWISWADAAAGPHPGPAGGARLSAVPAQPSDLAKNVYLTALHDRNEVLFYRLLGDHLAEMLPIVYTPTVGTAIERYSYEYRRPAGVYLSVDTPEDIERSLTASGLGPGDVDLIVATDARPFSGSATGVWAASTSPVQARRLHRRRRHRSASHTGGDAGRRHQSSGAPRGPAVPRQPA